jgi:hypothetical protein
MGSLNYTKPVIRDPSAVLIPVLFYVAAKSAWDPCGPHVSANHSLSPLLSHLSHFSPLEQARAGGEEVARMAGGGGSTRRRTSDAAAMGAQGEAAGAQGDAAGAAAVGAQGDAASDAAAGNK